MSQAYGWSALHRGLSEGSLSLFTRVSEKSTEIFQRLGRQMQPRNEHGTSCLPFFESSHSWSFGRAVLTYIPFSGFEPGNFDVAASSSNHYTSWSVAIYWDSQIKFIEKRTKTIFYFLLPISRESIAFASNFRNGDFDGFARLKGPWIQKS